MAFDNVTFFEVNLPNEVFGPSRADETDVERVEVEEPADESGGGKGTLLLATIALAGVAIAVRRFRSGGDEEDVEMAYEEPGVEVQRTEP
jgi:hypothetical protein